MFSTLKYDDEKNNSLDAISVELKDNGFYIIKNAVSLLDIDNLVNEIEEIIKSRNRRDVLFQQHGSGRTLPICELEGDAKGARFVDLMMSLETAQKVLLTDKIINSLKQIFDTDPVLFQSLSFEYGSEQALHQDTAYVVTQPPMNLVGVWIALEDIKPGSGELKYAKGSHKLPYFFQEKTDKFHWNRDLDGDQLHSDYLNFLEKSSIEKSGIIIEHFLPEKGDALIWHSQLAHGGSKISNDSLTRKSLVGHFCPMGTLPNWSSSVRKPKESTINPNAFIMSQYNFD